MTTKGAACPYCRSDQIQLLADQHGTVGWCQHCHRAWIPNQQPSRPPEDRKQRMAG